MENENFQMHELKDYYLNLISIIVEFLLAKVQNFEEINEFQKDDSILMLNLNHLYRLFEFEIEMSLVLFL